MPQQDLSALVEALRAEDAALKQQGQLPLPGIKPEVGQPTRPVNIDRGAPPLPETDLDEMSTGKRMLYQAARGIQDESAFASSLEDVIQRNLTTTRLPQEGEFRAYDAYAETVGGGPNLVEDAPSDEEVKKLADEIRMQEVIDQEKHLTSKIANRGVGTIQFLLNLAALGKVPGLQGTGLTGSAMRFGTHEALRELPEGPAAMAEGGAKGAAMGAGLHGVGMLGQGVAGKLIPGTGVIASKLRSAIPQVGIGAALGGTEGPGEAAIDATLFGVLGAAGRSPLGPRERVKALREAQNSVKGARERAAQEWKVRQQVQQQEVEQQKIQQAERQIAAEEQPIIPEEPKKPEVFKTPSGEKYTLPPGIEPGSAREFPEVSEPRYRVMKTMAPPETPERMVTTEQINKHLDRLQASISTLKTSKIRSGRGVKLMKGVRGQFHPFSERMDLKTAGNIETRIHEINHHLQKVMFGGVFKVKDLVPFAEELAPLATLGDPLVEGMAEFGRLYITDPATAKRFAPKFYDEYGKLIETRLSRKEAGLVLKTQDLYDQWARQGGGYKSIFHKPESHWQLPSVQGVKEGFRRWYYGIFDSTFKSWQLAKIYEQQTGKKMPADLHPGIVMRLLPGGMERGDIFMTKGIIDGKTSHIIPDSMSFAKATEPLKGMKDSHEFSGYYLARHVEAMRKKATRLDQEIADLEVQLESGEMSKADARKVQAQISVKSGTIKKLLRISSEVETQAGYTQEKTEKFISDTKQKYPEFPKVVENLMEWNDGLLQYAVDKGAITPAEKQALMDIEVYAPLNRYIEETKQGAITGSGKTVTNVPNVAKRRKGGTELPIIDPLVTMFTKGFSIPRLADRHYAGNTIVNAALAIEGGDRFVWEVDRPVRPVSVELWELKRTLEEAFGGELPEGFDLNAVAAIFRPDSMFPMGDKGNIISVLRPDGKRKLFGLDKDLFNSIATYDSDMKMPANPILKGTLKTARTVTRLKRFSIVTDPAFAAANLTRDFVVRAVQTGQINPLDIVNGWREILWRKSGVYDLYRSAGASMSGMMERDLRSAQKSLKNFVGQRGKKEAIVGNVLYHPREIAKLAFEISESPGRIATFKKRLAKPLPQDVTEGARTARAAYEARESTIDFARRGAWINGLSQITSFMNPTLQGIDKFARTTKDHPIRMAMGLSSIASGTAYLWMHNMSDEYRKEVYFRQPDYVKDYYHVLVFGSKEEYDQLKTDAERSKYAEKHLYMVPKSFEYGWVGGTLLERLVLEPMFRAQPIKSSVENLANSMEVLIPPLVPDLALPVLEGLANKSFFRQAPLDTKSEEIQNISPHLRYGDNTSEFAKAAGMVTGISPRQIDNAIKVGALFREGIELSDDLIEYLRGDEAIPKAERGLRDTPIIRNIIRRFRGSYPSTSAQPIQDFYDIYGEVMQAKADYTKLVNDAKALPGDTPQKARSEALAEDYHQKNYWKIALSSSFRKFSERMKKHRDDLTRIRGSRSLSPEEKRAAEDEAVFNYIEDADGMIEFYTSAKAQMEKSSQHDGEE